MCCFCFLSVHCYIFSSSIRRNRDHLVFTSKAASQKKPHIQSRAPLTLSCEQCYVDIVTILCALVRENTGLGSSHTNSNYMCLEDTVSVGMF